MITKIVFIVTAKSNVHANHIQCMVTKYMTANNMLTAANNMLTAANNMLTAANNMLVAANNMRTSSHVCEHFIHVYGNTTIDIRQ